MKSVSRIKIGIGFAFMLGVLLFTLLFVNREMERLTRTETDNSIVWDSLQTLIKRKDENTLKLLRMMGQAGDSLMAADEIVQLVERHDTIIVRQQVSRRVITRRDTLRTPAPKKKGFFKRLGEAFAPPKEDTTVQVRITTEVATDTVTYDTFNPADSLKELLHDAAHRQQLRNERVGQRKQYLKKLDRMLSARIDSLMKGQEQQALEAARIRQEQNRAERLEAARTVGGIAAGGIALAAVFLLIIGRDIARSNRYRKQTEEAREKAEDLLNTRERMMLAITHDFKAPLGTVKGYAELLERLTDDPRQRFYLKSMTDAADHLLKLVTDLLEFHRLERGRVEITRVAFCPARLIEEVADAFMPIAQSKGLELHTQTGTELENNFIGAPLRIKQILNNLTGNAVKFTEQGTVTLEAHYDNEHRQITISVADTGPGMTAEEKKRIWDEFTRLPGAQGKEGCGLGLSIVKLLMELLEGQVEVDSVPGKGSRFTVNIPLFPVAENGKPGRKKLSEKIAGTKETEHKTKKLLLIDDDRLQLQLTRAMLQEVGIEAVACLQVDDLLEALRTEHFDALLTDIQMPAISGVDLLRLLRASNIPQARTIPIVAVTARADTNQKEMQEQGFAGLLHKPFEIKELAEILDTDITPASAEKNRTGLQPNLKALLAYSGDDLQAAQDILQSFVSETRLAIKQMQKAAKEKDIHQVAAIAHKLIPLFILIGADHTVALLRKLEAQKNEDYQNMVKQVTEEVNKILDRGEKMIDPHTE